MRRSACLSLCLFAAIPVPARSAPVPEAKYAKPAVIDAGTETNVVAVLACLAAGSSAQHRALIHDEKVPKLDVVRRQKDARDWLGKNLRIERVAETNHVRVSLRVGTPGEQAIIINAVVDQYLEEVGRTRVSLRKSLQGSREIVANLAAKGKLRAEESAKAGEKFKKDEECIRALPALIEYAKAR